MLRKISRSALASVAIAVPLVFATTTPAYATTAATSVVTGSGTISPGLGVAGPPQTFSFASSSTTTTGLACDAQLVGSGAVTISASGNDIIGSYAAGTGAVTIKVKASATCELTLVGTYVRVGVAVVVAASAGTNAAGGVCVFQPVQSPPAPVTNYNLTCAASMVGTA